MGTRALLEDAANAARQRGAVVVVQHQRPRRPALRRQHGEADPRVPRGDLRLHDRPLRGAGRGFDRERHPLQQRADPAALPRQQSLAVRFRRHRGPQPGRGVLLGSGDGGQPELRRRQLGRRVDRRQPRLGTGPPHHRQRGRRLRRVQRLRHSDDPRGGQPQLRAQGPWRLVAVRAPGRLGRRVVPPPDVPPAMERDEPALAGACGACCGACRGVPRRAGGAGGRAAVAGAAPGLPGHWRAGWSRRSASGSIRSTRCWTASPAAPPARAAAAAAVCSAARCGAAPGRAAGRPAPTARSSSRAAPGPCGRRAAGPPTTARATRPCTARRRFRSPLPVPRAPLPQVRRLEPAQPGGDPRRGPRGVAPTDGRRPGVPQRRRQASGRRVRR
ncbi:MAG: hypothetical protein MZV63_06120 [Marinilabiliales bacterium]|nr:hypothetical protein [Marinilabiliales bacterium]